MAPRRMLTSCFSLLAVFLVATVGTAAAAAGIQYFQVGSDGVITPAGTAVPTEAVYQNEQDSFVPNSQAQNGEEWADDLHCSHAGYITGFGAGFDGQPKGDFDVTLTLYAASTEPVFQSSGELPPGDIIYGPWTFHVDQSTIGIFVSFAPGPLVGPDLWLGARFSDPSMGLTRHDPPQVGTSHDLYWNVAQNAKGDFAGDPPANFVTRVEVAAPVPVEPTTWGHIKALLPIGH